MASCGKNVIILGIADTSTTYADKRKNDIIILKKRLIGLNDATTTAEAEHF